MAALSGVLRADFAEFLTAVENAETKLRGFETGSSKVETALNRMINSFSGQKIISEATLAVEAVERIGGASALTEAEQEKVNRTVTEAIAKYEALQQVAPPAMLELAAATAKADEPTKQLGVSMVAVGGAMTTTTVPAIKQIGEASATSGKEGLTLSQNFQQVDKVLAAVGISLGPIPGAIQEIVTAAGKAAGTLSTMATAGLAVGAAAAGWNVGRWIADWGGLDEKIANATSKLMGWGDLAAETAAYKTEQLAKASKLAGYEITNMDQAVAILAENTKKLGEEQQKAAAEATKLAEFSARLFSRDDIARAQEYVVALDGVQNVSKLTADKKKELHEAIGDALTAYAALGEKAPAAMRQIYDATTELITVTRSFSAANSGMWVQFAAGVEDGKRRMAEIAEAAKLHWSDIGGKSKAELEAVAATAKANYELAVQYADHFTGKQIADFRRAAAEAQAAVEAWGTDTIEAYDAAAAAAKQSADSQVADVGRVKAQVDSTTAAVTSWSEAMAAVRAGAATMTGQITADLSPAGRASTQRAWEEGRYWGPVVGGTAQNPRGTGVDWKALGWDPAAADKATATTAARSADIRASRGAGSGGGSTTINVSTVMGDPTEIARVVRSALVDAARSRGEQLPIDV